MIAENIPNPCPLTLIANETKKPIASIRNLAKRLGCNVRENACKPTVAKSDALRIFNEILASKEKSAAKHHQTVQTETISQPTNHKENVMQFGFLTLADIAKANNITNERAKEILDAENIKPALYPDEDTPVPLYKDKVCGRVERFLIAEAAAEQARKEAKEKAAEEERKRIEAEKAAEEERKRIETENMVKKEREPTEADKAKEGAAQQLLKKFIDDRWSVADESFEGLSAELQSVLLFTGLNESLLKNVCKEYYQTQIDNGQRDEVYRRMLTNLGYLANMTKQCDGKIADVGVFKGVPLWMAKASQQRDSAVVAQVLATNEVTRELMIANNLLRDLLNATKENLEQTRRLADALGTPEKQK